MTPHQLSIDDIKFSTHRGGPDERFWAKVQQQGECWVWTGALRGGGYGVFFVSSERRLVPAHRVAYEWLVGPIPAGLPLDHLCRNRACVRPLHLEPVTERENILRGTGPAARNAAATQCQSGHAFDQGNTIWRRRGAGWRRKCRVCENEIKRRAWARQRQARQEAGTYVPRNGVKTQCIHGHAFTPENTYLTADGRRRCRACNRESHRGRKTA